MVKRDEPEELCNTETEEETVALHRKRSRRVSFAEQITSVRFFDRDEDYETPPESKPQDTPLSDQRQPHHPILGFPKGSPPGSDDSKQESSQNVEDDDDDESDYFGNGGKTFLCPTHSPSPGSTTGSASSFNDEDKFFGPVSASFIRPRRQSDSAISDEHHDITMDSTAFSMHFRSLAQSDLGGDARTPTGVHLAYTERTPSQNTTSASGGSSMVLTGAKKPLSLSPLPVNKFKSCGGDSNDMSLVGENPHRYDFGRLSPGLDGILIEGSKDLYAASIFDKSNVLKASDNLKVNSMSSKNETDIMDYKFHGDVEPASIDNDLSSEKSPAAHLISREPSSSSTSTPTDRIICGSPSKIHDAPTADTYADQTPRLTTRAVSLVSVMNNGIVSYADSDILKAGLKVQQESRNLISPKDLIKKMSPHGRRHTSNANHTSSQEDISLLASISLSSAERQTIDLDSGVPFRHLRKLTSSPEKLSSYMGKEHRRLGDIGSSIQESLSKLKTIQASPCFKHGTARTKLSSSNFLTKTPFSMLCEEDNRESHFLVFPPTSQVGELGLDVVQKDGECEAPSVTDHRSCNTSKIGNPALTKERPMLVSDGESLHVTPVCAVGDDKPLQPTASPTHDTQSGVRVPQHSLNLKSYAEGALGISSSDSSMVRDAHNYRKNEKACDASHDFVSSQMQVKHSGSENIQNSFCNDSELKDQHVKTFPSVQHGDSSDVPDAIESARVVANFMPSIAINHSEAFSQRERISDGTVGFHGLYNELSLSKIDQTHLKNKLNVSLQSGSPDNNLLVEHFEAVASTERVKDRPIGSPDPHYERTASKVFQTPSSIKENVNLLSGHPISSLIVNNNIDVFDGSEKIDDKALSSHDLLTASKVYQTPLREKCFSPGNQNSSLVASDSEANAQIGRLNDRTVGVHDLCNNANASTAFKVPSCSEENPSIQSGTPDSNLLIKTNLARFMKEHPGGGLKASTSGSAFTYACRENTSPRDIQSPFRKISYNARDIDSPNNFVRKGRLSSESDHIRHGCENNDLQLAADIPSLGFSMQDTKNSLGQKRSGEDIFLRDPLDEITGSCIDSKVQKDDSHALKFESQRNSTSRQWSDICSEVVLVTKQFLSFSTNKLNIQVIYELEDIVGQLQKVEVYKSLCSKNLCQKLFDPYRDVRHKRIAEIKLLLFEIVYEHAKLQLLCSKRDRLLKKVHLLNSGIEKSRVFKSTFSQHLHVPNVAGAQFNDSGSQLCSFYLEGKHKLQYDQMMTMKQELEALDSKVKSLTKFLHTSCKIEEELISKDIITLANDHLKRRMCYRLLCQYLQLWQVDDLESRLGHHSVVLNYQGLIFHRLRTYAGGTVVVKEFNDKDILKRFPNMNALAAFSFVFDAESTRKNLGPKSLAQETQITSMFLSNLLDVVEEVQLAQVQLKNLIRASFCRPSADNLHIEFCFTDFKYGKKIVLTLEVSCLNRGVYPLEVLPFLLANSVSGSKDLPPQSLIAEVTDEVRNLEAGYMRIIRICRCVSHVVHASKTGW